MKGGRKGGAEAEAPVKRTRQPSKVMWRVSDELAAVVGSTEATVDTIRSGVHRYIKEHNLQVGWVGGVWGFGMGYGIGGAGVRGVFMFMLGRSGIMTIDTRISAMPGRSTSVFFFFSTDRADIACTEREAP